MLLTYQKCKTQHSMFMSIGLFKESLQILKKATIPEMNSDAAKVWGTFLVTVKFNIYNETTKTSIPNFDFVLLDKGLFGEEYDNRSSELPANILPSYNDESKTLLLVKGGVCIATFEQKDIPASNTSNCQLLTNSKSLLVRCFVKASNA